MSSILPVLSSAPAVVSRPANNLNQAEAPTSSLFGNLLRQSQVTKTGFSAGATYEATTVAGQTKATVNSAVNATKSFFNIK
jgi:hypothetical protein